MKTKLLILTVALICALTLTSCTRDEVLPPVLNTAANASCILGETEDMGDGYIDSFVFFGESTTYHMINRGVLTGGTSTHQVWGPNSGTVNLDSTTASLLIRYPETGEYLSVQDATAKKKPAYLVLTFGLNGAVQNVKRGKDYYKNCYRSLIQALRIASPDTKIILQSCFPVAENMDMQYYSVNVDELNALITTINSWVLELAEEEELRYLDTAEILTDENGRLFASYQIGDGHHLTREAYIKILYYIRTHGYE